MPQLDSLRALAVIAVVAHHSIKGSNPLTSRLAETGVHLFFVLSGFLVTSALLKARHAIQAKRTSFWVALKTFYVRRALRIYPLYFGVILLALALNLGDVRSLLPWLITYSLNIKMASQGWYEAFYAHFWTLAVEHQFYLFWPIIFLIAPTPRPWLMPALLILIAILSKIHYILSGFTSMTGLALYISTIANLEFLGLGAIVSILVPKLDARLSALSNAKRTTFLLLPIIYTTLCLLAENRSMIGGKFFYIVFGNTLFGVGYAGIIASFALSFRGVIGAALLLPPLQYLGLTSYGIYVLHPIVLESMKSVSFLRSLPGLLVTCLALFIALGLSALSWHCLEKPCLKLKPRALAQ